MSRYEPSGDAEDPRFARHDRSGRHDDYRSAGPGSAGTRGRTPERYDRYPPRTYRDSPSRDSPSRGSRAGYDGYPPTGGERRQQRQRNADDQDPSRDYRGDPRRHQPPPPEARNRDRYPADPRTGARPGARPDAGPGRHAQTGSGATGGGTNGYSPDGRRERGTGERYSDGRGADGRGAVRRGYDESRPRTDRSQPRTDRPGRQYPVRPAREDDYDSRDDYDSYRAHDRPSRPNPRSQPRPRVPQRAGTSHGTNAPQRAGVPRPSSRPPTARDLYEQSRRGVDYDSDVDTAGRPRFVPYDYGHGHGTSGSAPSPNTGRSPWLIFAAACVVAVVVLVAAALSRSSRDQPAADNPNPDPTAAQSVAPDPNATATGVPQLTYGQELPVVRNGAQVGVLSVGSPEGVESFYAGTYTPDRGSKFATFKVTMRNTSGAPLEYNMFEFYVQSAAGERLDPTIGRDPAFENGSVAPGKTVSGWISFDAGDHGTLVYSPAAFGMIVAKWPF